MRQTDPIRSPSKWFLCTLLLALILRLVCWWAIDTIYRDSVGFILDATRANQKSFLQDRYQEPIYPLAIFAVHKVLFPHEGRTELLNSSGWELAAFTVTMISTVVCIWMLFAIGRLLHSPAAGLWAAFFLAIQPFAIRYTVHGLSEMPFMAVVLTGLYLTMISQTRKYGLLFLAGVTAMVLVLIRKEGIVLAGTIFLYLVFQRQFPSPPRTRSILAFGAGFLTVLAAFLLIGGRFNWLGSYFEVLHWNRLAKTFSVASDGQPQYILASLWMSSPYEFLIQPLAAWIKMSGFFPAILFIVYLLRRRHLQVGKGAWLLSLYFVLHLAAVMTQMFRQELLVTRYLFPPAVVTFPLAAIALVEIIRRLNLKLGRPEDNRRVSAIISLVMILALVPESLKNSFTDRRPQIRAAANWLTKNIPFDAVVFTDEVRAGFYCQCRWKPDTDFRWTLLFEPKTDPRPWFYACFHKNGDTKECAEALEHIYASNYYGLKPYQTVAINGHTLTIYQIVSRSPVPPTTQSAK